jgi:hypothetical protein
LKLPTLKLSAPIVAILVVQIITLAMLTMNLLSLPPYALGSIEQLPPAGFLYYGGELSWIGSGRTISHVITALMNVVIGILCIWYGMVRKLKMIKFITIAMGLQFIFGALTHISIAGVITTGGWWHVCAFAITMLTAIASVSTAVVFGVLQRHLRHLGEAHDDHIETTGTDK